MKSFFRKSLSLLMILCFVFVGISVLTVNADTEEYVIATSCDFTTKKSGASGYNTSWTYDTDWNVTNGANNSKGWEYVKFGGKKATLSTANPCYLNNKTKIKDKIVKITVSIEAGSLSKVGMAVNSWGVYAYSDAAMTTQIDYVAGGTITNAAATFDFVPSPTKTWPSGTYFKVSFDLANTTTTNGIICVKKVDFYKNNEAIISFNANEGTGTAPEEIAVAINGTSTALPANSFTREGYNFVCWNTSADGTGTDYAVGATIANVTENIELFAKWELDSSNYTQVTFNANNGAEPETSTQGVEIGVATALNLNTFINGTKKFVHWTTEQDGSGESYLNGANITCTAPITLYAQWSEYSIAAVIAAGCVDAGYTISGEITSITANYQATIQDSTGAIQINDYAAITTNAEFVVGNTVSFEGTYNLYNGYPQIKSLQNINVISSDTVISTAPLTNNADVVAANIYKYIELDNILINTVSGTTATVVGESFKLYYGIDDYVVGDENFTANTYVNIKGVITSYNNVMQVTVTSVEKCTQYSLVFNVDGGTVISSQVVLAGNKFTQPTAPTKAEDTNYSYTFDGWYTDTTWATPFDFDTVYAEDKIAYAKWTQTELLSIQKDLNGINSYMGLAYSYACTSGTNYSYIKVTNTDLLCAGDQVIITCDTQKAIVTGFSSKYLSTTKYTDTPDYSGAYVFTLGGDSTGWTLTSTDGALGANSTKDLNVSGQDVTTWTISIVSGVATINSTDSGCGTLKYNSSSPRVKTYASGQTAINLYKKVADRTFSASDFRIRCGVDKELSLVIDGFDGAVYGIEVKCGETVRKYESTNALYYTDDANCDYVIIDLGDCMNNTSRLSSAFTVRAYVTYNSQTYYSTLSKTYSVYGLLNTYFNNEDTKSLVKNFYNILIEMGLVK